MSFCLCLPLNQNLIPFLLEGVATVPGLMQDDGIHPTAEAQERLLDNVWPTLAPMLGLAPDTTATQVDVRVTLE